MKQILIPLLICALNIVAATGTRAAADDDEEKGVLGGSPPIYAGLPVIGTSQPYRSNRYVPVGRKPEPETMKLGDRCATRAGLFGPGPRLPIGENCAGIDKDGRRLRGQVVADGLGKFCRTSEGTYGPGLEQAIGLPCSVETKAGLASGRIVGGED